MSTGDILDALFQRGYHYREHVYSVVQVFAELTLLHHRVKIAVSGGNEPNVHKLVCCRLRV